MIVRLLLGLLKGLVVGGLLGFAAAKAGLANPGPIVAYLGAALAGVLVGLVAGKPIWAKDAKIEAGMKALVGALLGAGLMWATRRWLSGIPFPVDLGNLTLANTTVKETAGGHGTVGGLALTSFAVVAAVLGAFYDADNTPGGEGDKPAESAKNDTSKKARVAPAAKAADDEEDADEAPPEKRAKR